jgi:hypothetical protein
MTQMVFRHGKAKQWKGVGYDFKIISEDELQEYLDAGWFAHPDELLNDAEEPEPAKKTRKKKAVSDESQHEG